MVTLTKGEGFGRPLLEFTMTGKPVIASNWSGHKDFLPMDKAIMIGGKLTEVHESAVDTFILKDSKWFTANYDEFAQVLILVKKDYDEFMKKSIQLKDENKSKFTLENMKEKFKNIIEPFSSVRQETKLVLPKLTKL